MNLSLIRKQGGSRVIAITKVLPKDWQAIDLTVKSNSKKRVVLIIDRVR